MCQVRASLKQVASNEKEDTGADCDLQADSKGEDCALQEEGRDCIRQYLEDFDKAVQVRFQMLRELRDALEKERLMLYFQPQISLYNGEIIGAEALLRCANSF